MLPGLIPPPPTHSPLFILKFFSQQLVLLSWSGAGTISEKQSYCHVQGQSSLGGCISGWCGDGKREGWYQDVWFLILAMSLSLFSTFKGGHHPFILEHPDTGAKEKSLNSALQEVQHSLSGNIWTVVDHTVVCNYLLPFFWEFCFSLHHWPWLGWMVSTGQWDVSESGICHLWVIACLHQSSGSFFSATRPTCSREGCTLSLGARMEENLQLTCRKCEMWARNLLLYDTDLRGHLLCSVT